MGARECAAQAAVTGLEGVAVTSADPHTTSRVLRCRRDEPIELWAWVGAYDHVALCQLWGPMTHLPPPIPRFTHELRQLWEERGSPRMPRRSENVHDALVDARDQRTRYQVITLGAERRAVRAAGDSHRP